MSQCRLYRSIRAPSPAWSYALLGLITALPASLRAQERVAGDSAAAPAADTKSEPATPPPSPSAPDSAPAPTAAAGTAPAPPLPALAACKAILSTDPTPPVSTETPPSAPPLHPAAQADFESAKKLLARDDAEGALIKLERASKISRAPQVLLLMLETQRKLHLYTAMVDTLEWIITYPGAGFTPQERQSACQARSKAGPFLGAIRVVASEAAAVVVINDKAVGSTPLTEVARVDGERPVHVRVSKDGFAPFTWKGNVPAGREVTLTAALQKDIHEGTLTVDGEDGSLVSVDTAPVGLTPWSGVLKSGPHTLAVTAPQRSPFHLEVTVHDSVPRTVPVVLPWQVPKWVWALGGVLLASGAAIARYEQTHVPT